MRYSEINEGVFKNISQLLGLIAAEVKVADCNFDRETLTINLSFELQGDRGWLSLRARDASAAQVTFLRKLKAAAISEMRGGRPHTIGDAMEATRRVHPNSIKILTNLRDLQIVGAEWGELSYGI